MPRPTVRATLLTLITAGAARAQTAAPATALRDVPAAGPVAFVDVSVVPMDRERALPHQTQLELLRRPHHNRAARWLDNGADGGQTQRMLGGGAELGG